MSRHRLYSVLKPMDSLRRMFQRTRGLHRIPCPGKSARKYVRNDLDEHASKRLENELKSVYENFGGWHGEPAAILSFSTVLSRGSPCSFPFINVFVGQAALVAPL